MLSAELVGDLVRVREGDHIIEDEVRLDRHIGKELGRQRTNIAALLTWLARQLVDIQHPHPLISDLLQSFNVAKGELYDQVPELDPEMIDQLHSLAYQIDHLVVQKGTEITLADVEGAVSRCTGEDEMIQFGEHPGHFRLWSLGVKVKGARKKGNLMFGYIPEGQSPVAHQHRCGAIEDGPGELTTTLFGVLINPAQDGKHELHVRGGVVSSAHGSIDNYLPTRKGPWLGFFIQLEAAGGVR